MKTVPVLCDVVCTGRFYDFVVRHEGAVEAAAPPAHLRKGPHRPGGLHRRARSSTPARLATFPEGYRHLAYIQTGIGYRVKLDMPMLKGPVVEALYGRGARWLAGGELER